MPAYILPLTADNAEGQLNSGITAGSTSFVLDDSGEADLFPQPIIGTASSAGDSDTLNSTGIQAAGVAVGDFIENVTDGSHAYVTAVDTNSVETTTLQGGSDNTWDSGDSWAVGRFIVTINKRTTNTEGSVSVDTITQSEKVLIGNRSGTSFSVASGGRGYDGSTAASFATGDYVSLFDTSLLTEGLRSAVAEVAKQVKEIEDDYLTSSNISDTAYGSGWNGVTDTAPSKNAVYDIVASIVAGNAEADAFFAATDITGSEAETLTDGSNADTLHVHEANADDVFASPVSSTTSVFSASSPQVATTLTTYTLLKEIEIKLSGTYKTAIKALVSGGSGTAYIQLYKNGVAFGTEQTADNTEKTEDLALERGDLLQFYGKSRTGGTLYTSIFELRATILPLVAVKTI